VYILCVLEESSTKNHGHVCVFACSRVRVTLQLHVLSASLTFPDTEQPNAISAGYRALGF